MKKAVVRAHHIPEVIREVIALCQILKRLGFDDDEIGIQPMQDAVLVVLNVHGKQAGVGIRADDYNPETFEELWYRAALCWNGAAEDICMSDTTKDYIIRSSRIMERSVDLITALMLAGINIPGPNRNREALEKMPAGPVTFLSKGGDA